MTINLVLLWKNQTKFKGELGFKKKSPLEELIATNNPSLVHFLL